MTGAEQARIDDLRRTFNDSACERLVNANSDYYNEHGYYLPALARLVLIERADLSAAEAALREAREALAAAPFPSRDTDGYFLDADYEDWYAGPRSAALARSGEQT